MTVNTTDVQPRAVTAVVALLLASMAASSWATSSATSLVSESLGASVGSASDSFRGSSHSSSRATRTVAGEFRIVEVVAVAAVDQRPGRSGLVLEPLPGNPSAGFTLELPQLALAQTTLAAGDVIVARQRPYGTEFSFAQRAFYLVLDDAWYRELPSRPVTL